MSMMQLDPSLYTGTPGMGKEIGDSLKMLIDPVGHRAEKLRNLFISNPEMATMASTMMQTNPKGAGQFFKMKPEMLQEMLGAVQPDIKAMMMDKIRQDPGMMQQLAEEYVAPGVAKATAEAAAEVLKEKAKVDAEITAAEVKHRRELEVEEAKGKVLDERARLDRESLEKRARISAARAPAEPKAPVDRFGRTAEKALGDFDTRMTDINKLVLEFKDMTPKVQASTKGVPTMEPPKFFNARRRAVATQINRLSAEASKRFGKVFPTVDIRKSAPTGKLTQEGWTMQVRLPDPGAHPIGIPPAGVGQAAEPAPATEASGLSAAGMLVGESLDSGASWADIEAEGVFNHPSLSDSDKRLLRLKYAP